MCIDFSTNKYSWISTKLTTTTDSPCFEWCDQKDNSRLVGVAVRSSLNTMKCCYCLFSIAIPSSFRWDKYAYNPARDQVREHPGTGDVQGAYSREQMEPRMLFVTKVKGPST
jgi:hypothetical protein